jgi:signal transduction histidine kinase
MNFSKFKIFIKNLFSSSRLRKKFLSSFFVIGIIPLIFMGMAGLYIVKQTHRIDIGVLEKQLLNFKISEIQKFVGDIVGMFQLRVSYEEYSEIEISQQQFIVDKMLEESQALQEVAFINVNGQETVKSLKEKNERKSLLDRSQSFEFITAINGEDYLGPIFYTDDGPIITIASPVYNKKDQIIAILAGRIRVSSIQSFITGAKLGSMGYVYVVDQSGTIIAHSEEKDIGKNLISQKSVINVLTGLGRIESGQNIVHDSYRDEKVISSSYLIPELNWGIIVEWPFNDAQKIIGLMTTQLIYFSLGTLILIFIFASLIALSLIKPISNLKESAQIIGGGNFKHRVRLHTGDEIEELGHSLNKMAISLAELEELKEIKLRAQYLTKSLKKERELSQLKNQFITIASHQLNTPLSVINWSLESIKNPDATKEEFKESIEAINQSRIDILAITSDLLTLSEIGFNYKKTKSEIIDVKNIINQVIKKSEPQAISKKINIKFEIKAKDTKADINIQAIEKVIENLIDNAISYSHDKGNVEIELSGDDEQLAFKIRDHGIGIPKEETQSLFKGFFRAKNATSKKSVGTGLGLFIVKNFIDGHGGKIWFESEENKGSIFYFTIPRGV